MKINLFYPASYLPHKNHDLLFLYADKIYKEIKEINFILTINKDIYKKETRNIKCIGKISRKKVYSLIKSSDALLFLSSFESLGIPIIEAAQNSVPIIAPSLPYCKELIGENGYYFDIDNNFFNSFIKAIFTLKKDIDNKSLKKSFLIPEIIETDKLIELFLKKLYKL